MREIKFKIRCGKEEVGPHTIEELCLEIPQGDQLKDDVVFRQYTGLKDKNGKEIYEGDIVKLRGIIWRVIFEKYDDGEQWANYTHLGWALKTESCLEDPEIRETLSDEHLNCEVIGNIYEKRGLKDI